MNNRPIGVFDSGVGGLTAVMELKKILPSENIIYFGDTGRVPYGTRSQDTIKKYTRQAIKFLSGFDVKAILAACGTVSSNFTKQDFSEMGIDIPYITVVEPAAKAAAMTTRNNKIGVIATSASIKSKAYDKEIKHINNDITISGQACPLLVVLVENGMTSKNNPITRAALEFYLEPVKKAQDDTLILGCTHFPLLKESILDILGGGVTLIDSGAQAAQELKRILETKELLSLDNDGRTKYYVTDTVESFSEVAGNFLAEDISGAVRYVDIETIDRQKQ